MRIIRSLLLAGLAVFHMTAAHAAPVYRVDTLAQGLEHPWSLAFLPDGRMLITERAGRLRVFAGGRLLPEPVSGVPQSYVASQGGLFEVLPDPGYAENQFVYLSLAHGSKRENATRVVRGRLQGMSLTSVQPVFTARPMKDTAVHYGGRMAFLADGTLAITLGDGFNYRENAQLLDDHFGSIVRINPDGSVPADNPFVGRPDVLPEIYSYGHRNVQGLVWDAAGQRLYAHEHGPRGGDELNLIQPGVNYGWPVITYGIDYSGALISPYKEMDGMAQPLVQWTPSIAPAGMTLYTGRLFPAWRGDLFVAALAEKSLRRLRMAAGRVISQELLLTELGERLREVRTGPDGAIYLLTDSANGKLLRLSPAK